MSKKTLFSVHLQVPKAMVRAPNPSLVVFCMPILWYTWMISRPTLTNMHHPKSNGSASILGGLKCVDVCPTKYPLLNQRDLRGIGNITVLDIRNMRPVCYAINLTADQVVSSCAGSKHPYQVLAPCAQRGSSSSSNTIQVDKLAVTLSSPRW